jgi:branched-chain amino acid transport system ATP-binding protein
MGIARTFQNIRLPAHLSVLDNVKTACHRHARYGLANALLRTPLFRGRERLIAQQALACLRLFGLEQWADEPAASLPYGRQKKLEIARALATEAELLLLDEPAAGLNAQETAELASLVRDLRDRFRVTVLLIEHDMRMVMSLCEWVEVLDHGRVIARGTPQQVKTNERVIEAYLGRPKRAETPQP